MRLGIWTRMAWLAGFAATTACVENELVVCGELACPAGMRCGDGIVDGIEECDPALALDTSYTCEDFG